MRSLSARQAERADPFYNVWDYPNSKISFVALNTSALSIASLGGNEQGRLVFPDLAVNKAFQNVNGERFVISLAHHPLSWFQDESATEMRTTIAHKSKLHLYGHLHDPEPMTVRSSLGTTTFVQASSLFSNRKYLNGYCSISLSPDQQHVAVAYRTYYDKRRAFAPAENVAPKGLFFANSESEAYWTNQPLGINLKKYRRWLTEVALVEKVEFFNETTVGKKLSDVFVCPPLHRIEIAKKDEDLTNDPFTYKKVTLDALLAIEGNVLIFCPLEHGQSSFAKQMALNYLLKTPQFALPRLPLILDCASLRSYPASFVGMLKAQAPDLTSLQKRLETILEEGLAFIILENVTASNTDQNDFIRTMMERYRKNKFLIIIRSSFSGKLDSLIELKFPNVTETLHIQAYSRSLVREFMRKSRPQLRTSEDVALDQIIARFNQLGLPLTPVYLALLFRIFEQDNSFQPTNTASLVENFVEKTLNKANIDARREVFDYKNRVGLLAYLAQQMIDDDLYLVDFTLIYSWTKDYLERLGFDENVQGLVGSFCDARIFSLIGNSVQFRQDMFLAYFAAQRMIINAEFAEAIIGGAGRFLQEVDIFCGLKRFDENILDALARKFADVDSRLRDKFPNLPELSAVDGLELPKDETVLQMLTSVTEQLTAQELTHVERDKFLDPPTPPSLTQDGKLKRPEANSVAIEWITILKAYTIALKNLEEIDAEKKARSLQIVLNAWGRAIGYLIMLIRLAFEKDIDLGGATISVEKLGELKPLVLRSLLIGVPNMIAGIIRNDLGTEKLRLMFGSINPAGNESVTIRFLNEGLYLDLRLPEFNRRIEALRKAVSDKPFFKESLLVRLLDSYIRFPIKGETEDNEYRRTMATLSADMAGKRGGDRDAFVAKQLQSYKRQQIISKLKTE